MTTETMMLPDLLLSLDFQQQCDRGRLSLSPTPPCDRAADWILYWRCPATAHPPIFYCRRDLDLLRAWLADPTRLDPICTFCGAGGPSVNFGIRWEPLR